MKPQLNGLADHGGDPLRPRLKDVVWGRSTDAELIVVYDQREPLVVSDPDGTIERFLELLQEGSRSVPELSHAMSSTGEPVTVADVWSVLEVLDAHGLVVDGSRLGRYDGELADRHFSNLAFFETFASLAASQEDLVDRVRSSHVLVLGTGGLNSTTIPHLAGAGVGRLTVADRDVVEAKNFARQYLYAWEQIGRPKVEEAARWIRRFDPTIEVEARHLDVTGTASVAALLDELSPDLVMSGIDTPREVDLWVNDACMARGVPLVRGGMGISTAGVWSVWPDHSPCRRCLAMQADAVNASAAEGAAEVTTRDDVHALAAQRISEGRTRVNRGIGPIAGLIGSFAAFEVLRYLTGYEEPQYAGRLLNIDLKNGCATTVRPWEKVPTCAACLGRQSSPEEPVGRERVLAHSTASG
ncbi:molybdopterin biosynthesis protein (HesA/MoeB/ThiF familyprotein), putative [Janibacter sp. HTCC2649]|uniref:HesA/MoeB/ThiF family protein n=1 Tax=Janibacter sp. HTCC2649 TaxID=313589 RepID=UPI0000670C85|nr:ThiF family adenylyltransferase [Janibacter sp. HTCC2649]EAQ00707.1 molybdopterin biosynthesis protein (HesA/MoeB/ThiF familyprotein), putative [Janibacter sp. HTCC2649]